MLYRDGGVLCFLPPRGSGYLNWGTAVPICMTSTDQGSLATFISILIKATHLHIYHILHTYIYWNYMLQCMHYKLYVVADKAIGCSITSSDFLSVDQWPSLFMHLYHDFFCSRPANVVCVCVWVCRKQNMRKHTTWEEEFLFCFSQFHSNHIVLFQYTLSSQPCMCVSQIKVIGSFEILTFVVMIISLSKFIILYNFRSLIRVFFFFFNLCTLSIYI